MTKKKFFACLDYCQGTLKLESSLVSFSPHMKELFCVSRVDTGPQLTHSISGTSVAVQTVTQSRFLIGKTRGIPGLKRMRYKYAKWIAQYNVMKEERNGN